MTGLAVHMGRGAISRDELGSEWAFAYFGVFHGLAYMFLYILD